MSSSLNLPDHLTSWDDAVQPEVISLILNRNRKLDTLACLASLSRNTYGRHKTIVLDGASSDGSVEAIRTSRPAIEIIELAENLGYSGGNNVGIRAAIERGADWVFILNEDTILSPDCVARLVAAGEQDGRIGIVGPMVYHHDEPEVIQSAGGTLTPYWGSNHLGRNEIDCGQFCQPHPVDWVSGCAMMVRRAVIEKVGMLDPRFFCYWEETEWCLRVRKAGWKIVHVPVARVWHKGVQRDYHPKPYVTYYDTRNRLLMLQAHDAPLRAWLGTWFGILRTLTSWTIKPKYRPMREHRDAIWRGTIDFLRRRWGQMPQSRRQLSRLDA